MADTRSWHFTHPDAPGGGLSSTPAGRVALVGGAAAVRQALVMLLSTAPGERVMRPEYGCPLHRLVFQPLDDTTAGLAIHYVEQAVRRWEPRIDVLAVDAHPSPSHPGQLVVELGYRLRATGQQDHIAIDVPLEGGR